MEEAKFYLGSGNISTTTFNERTIGNSFHDPSSTELFANPIIEMSGKHAAAHVCMYVCMYVCKSLLNEALNYMLYHALVGYDMKYLYANMFATQ
jgi:hypothetical protein